MPNLGCGLRNQSGRTPSSETRLSTPLEPTIAVLTAPERIRKPDEDHHARSSASRAQCGPTTFIARPPIRLPLYLRHPHVIGNDHHGEEADQRREQQAVDEDDERRAS